MKPHKGTIRGYRHHHDYPGDNLGYLIIGRFENHPNFYNQFGHTSMVVAESFCEETDESPDVLVFEVETLNSRYTFIENKKEKE